MKLKIAVFAAALGIMANRGMPAQGYPVIDITSIIAAIQNGYTMYQQLQSTYETMKTNYNQLQQQIKSFQSFDFNSLDAKDPLGSWRSLLTYADRIMTYEQNIESIINRKDIRIGHGSYSLKELFMSPAKTAENMAMDAKSFIVDPFEFKLTPEEKAVFHRKYGMSYGNYMRISQMREMMKKKAAEVLGYSDRLQEDLAEDRKRLSNIAGDMYNSESAVQQQQINNAVLSIMAQDIKTQASLLGDIAGQIATAATQAQTEKQALEDELNINSLDVADGFLKMLENMPAENEYR